MSDKRTHAENVALVEQRLAGKSDADQWFEIYTMQLRESWLLMDAKIKRLESELAAERARCAGIVRSYIPGHHEPEGTVDTLNEIIREIEADGE